MTETLPPIDIDLINSRVRSFLSDYMGLDKKRLRAERAVTHDHLKEKGWSYKFFSALANLNPQKPGDHYFDETEAKIAKKIFKINQCRPCLRQLDQSYDQQDFEQLLTNTLHRYKMANKAAKGTISHEVGVKLKPSPHYQEYKGKIFRASDVEIPELDPAIKTTGHFVLDTVMPDGTVITQHAATGLVISEEGHVLTNAHVLDFLFPKDNDKTDSQGQRHVFFELNNQLYEIKKEDVIHHNRTYSLERHDYGLIQLKDRSSKKARPYKGPHIKIDLTDHGNDEGLTVFAIGHPRQPRKVEEDLIGPFIGKAVSVGNIIPDYKCRFTIKRFNLQSFDPLSINTDNYIDHGFSGGPLVRLTDDPNTPAVVIGMTALENSYVNMAHLKDFLKKHLPESSFYQKTKDPNHT